MNFYYLKSKAQNRYHIPFLAEDDKDAISRVTSMIVASNDQSIVMSLDDLYLVYSGFSFNPDFGICADFGEPKVLSDDLVRDLPFPPMIRNKINKLYGFEDSFDVGGDKFV